MPRWAVPLEGHEFDLADLPLVFDDGPLQVRKEGEVLFLEADEWEALHGAEKVHAAAEKVVHVVNGVMRVRDPGFRPVGVGTAVHEVRPDGSRSVHQFVSDTIEVRDKAWPVTVRLGGQQVPRPPDPAARWAELATHDKDAAEALDIWGNRPLDWVNLYRVYEIIEASGGLALGAVSEKEARRFKHTSNHQQGAGADARHARLSTNPPKDPMPLEEARGLIGRLLRTWLDSML